MLAVLRVRAVRRTSKVARHTRVAVPPVGDDHLVELLAVVRDGELVVVVHGD